MEKAEDCPADMWELYVYCRDTLKVGPCEKGVGAIDVDVGQECEVVVMMSGGWQIPSSRWASGDDEYSSTRSKYIAYIWSILLFTGRTCTGSSAPWDQTVF